jgi:hypothetical protein
MKIKMADIIGWTEYIKLSIIVARAEHLGFEKE